MRTTDVARLHQRIDELVERIGELQRRGGPKPGGLRVLPPVCAGRRRQAGVVDGLGKVQQQINDLHQTLSQRIAELSTEVMVLKSLRQIGGRLFWSGIGVAGTISGAVVGVFLKWWLDAAR